MLKKLFCSGVLKKEPKKNPNIKANTMRRLPYTNINFPSNCIIKYTMKLIINVVIILLGSSKLKAIYPDISFRNLMDSVFNWFGNLAIPVMKCYLICKRQMPETI